MKHIIAMMLAALAGPALAGPFLWANAERNDALGPSGVAYNVDDGPWITAGCTWINTATTKQPACDLSGTDKSPGVRKYGMKFTYADACLGTVCQQGGDAVAVPLLQTWKTPLAPSTLELRPSGAP